jgi:hypothetical protein
MKRTFDIFLLVLIWIITLVLLGAFANVSWSLLNVGWGLMS